MNCQHCGTPFTHATGNKEENFCCSGCRFVYNLLHEENLDRYYELKGDTTGTPIQNRPFAPLGLQWLEDLQNKEMAIPFAQQTSSSRSASVSPAGNHGLSPSKDRTDQLDLLDQSELAKLPHTTKVPLSRISRLRNSKTLTPVPSLITDHSALITSHSLTLQINGVTCLGCIWLIEKIYLQNPDATRIDIHPQTNQATLYWKGETFQLTDFATQIQQFGYLLSPPDTRARPPSLTTRLAICGGLALNTMAFSLPRYVGMESDFALAPLFDLIALNSATLALLIGGSHFFIRAWHAARLHTIHLDLPISLGLIVAWGGSLVGWLTGHRDLLYFDFVATFTFLMLGGRHIHQLATQRAQNESHRQSPLPENYRTPEETTIATPAITKNVALLIPPNTPVPVTSILQEKNAACSLAWINGEPDPLTYQPGQRLPAGAINLNAAPLHVITDENWADSLTARLTSPQTAPKNSALLGKIIKIYLSAILLITLAAGIYWFTHAAPTVALQVIISILVISCPCALGTAIPLLDQRASLALQRLGIFIQNTATWEKLPKIKSLLLDKTGTLTLQHPELDNPEILQNLTSEEKTILHHLTATSLHPLSRTLFQELSSQTKSASSQSRSTGVPPVSAHQTSNNSKNLPKSSISISTASPSTSQVPLSSISRISRFENSTTPAHNPNPHSFNSLDSRLNSLIHETPGIGLSTTINAHTYALGKTAKEEKSTSCTFTRDHQEIATFHFTETLRPNTIATFKNLTRLESHILSGDKAASVNKIASQLNIPEKNTHANLTPDQKATLTAQLNNEQPTLYIGDGANDALAFQNATLTATPVSDRSLLEKHADILFASTSLDFLPRLFATARWRQHTAARIFAFAIAYNAAAIAFCLMGKMNPLLATILMPASSLITLLIASRPVPFRKNLASLQKKSPKARLPDQQSVTHAEALSIPKKPHPDHS